MPMVPVITPTEKNSPNFSSLPRFEFAQYQITPNRVINCKGIQMTVKTLCQNIKTSLPSGSTFPKFNSGTVSKARNRNQDAKIKS